MSSTEDIIVEFKNIKQKRDFGVIHFKLTAVKNGVPTNPKFEGIERVRLVNLGYSYYKSFCTVIIRNVPRDFIKTHQSHIKLLLELYELSDNALRPVKLMGSTVRTALPLEFNIKQKFSLLTVIKGYYTIKTKQVQPQLNQNLLYNTVSNQSTSSENNLYLRANQPQVQQSPTSPVSTLHQSSPNNVTNSSPTLASKMISNNMLQLPPRFERKVTPQGRIYYIDHKTRQTSWKPFADIEQLISEWEKANLGPAQPAQNQTQPQQHQQQQSQPRPQILLQNPLPGTQATNLDTNLSRNTSSPSNALPAGWEEQIDGRSGRKYYIDHNTKTTTWSRPNHAHMASLDVWNERNQQSSLQAHNQRRNLYDYNSSSSNSRPQSPSISQNSSENIADLPPGWEKRYTPDKRVYYLDHINKRTTWDHPSIELLPLPAGWSKQQTDQGRTYFINHNDKTTTFIDPRRNVLYNPAGQMAIPTYKRDFRAKCDILRKNIQNERIISAKITGFPANKLEHKVTLVRDNLFESAFLEFMKCPVQIYKSKLKVSFLGEEGLDYGGVGREFFFLLSKEFTNPNYGLFTYATDNHTSMVVNPNSGINPDHLSYFKFAGRMLGLAIFHNYFMQTGFTLNFYKILLGKKVNLSDMEAYDPVIYKSLMWLKENEINELGLDMVFETDVTLFDVVKSVELKPGGSSIEVTDENKEEYIQLIIDFKIRISIQAQIDAILAGIFEIIPRTVLSLFDEQELEVLVSGVSEIDVDDWQHNSFCKGYGRDDQVVQWFWQFVRESDDEQKNRILQFVTGTCRIPMTGFADLQGSSGTQLFCISKVGMPNDLPKAHTCFNRIDLPPYPSYNVLKDKVTFAIDESSGFEIE